MLTTGTLTTCDMRRQKVCYDDAQRTCGGTPGFFHDVHDGKDDRRVIGKNGPAPARADVCEGRSISYG
jgi:hypothetical protein